MGRGCGVGGGIEVVILRICLLGRRQVQSREDSASDKLLSETRFPGAQYFADQKTCIGKQIFSFDAQINYKKLFAKSLNSATNNRPCAASKIPRRATNNNFSAF